jgi:hypothetical protein
MITGQFNGWPVVTMPSSPGFSTVDWTASSVVGVSTSPYNLMQQYQDWQADLLSATVDMPPMQRRDAQAWIAFLQQLRGGNCVFLMGDTLSAVPLGVATGSPVTTATNAAGSTQLSTTGWTPSVAGILLAGDYVQVGFRLYRCLDTVSSDSSGNASFSVFPRLRESIPAATAVQTRNTQGMFRLAKSDSTWSSSYLMTYGLSFQVREAI